MLRTLFITLLAAASCGATYAASTQKFTITGKIDGLQTGDTIRFSQIILPRWEYEPAFDILVEKPGRFSYKGTQDHDQYYMMTYHPKEGKVKRNDRSGQPVIVTAGDKIGLTGTADEIYYSALSGGIYDEPQLAEILIVDDSLGRIRGSYLRKASEAWEQKDTVANREWGQRFNLFYQNNPGRDRLRALNKAYEEANPQSTLYLLVELIPSLSYTETAKARKSYDAFSPELKESYYGRLYARQVEAMERLAKGKPAPDFSLVTTDGRTIAKKDFKGNYLLIYHWGMCPGSIYIDGQVKALYDKYKGKGFQVLGLTESIAAIRQVYEGLPVDQKTPSAGTDDIRPVLAGMLEHGWIEVEVETDHPENQSIMEAYAFTGWPFFVLIGPDGTIQARDFSPAFFEARTILDRELGGGETEKK